MWCYKHVLTANFRLLNMISTSFCKRHSRLYYAVFDGDSVFAILYTWFTYYGRLTAKYKGMLFFGRFAACTTKKMYDFLSRVSKPSSYPRLHDCRAGIISSCRGAQWWSTKCLLLLMLLMLKMNTKKMDYVQLWPTHRRCSHGQNTDKKPQDKTPSYMPCVCPVYATLLYAVHIFATSLRIRNSTNLNVCHVFCAAFQRTKDWSTDWIPAYRQWREEGLT